MKTPGSKVVTCPQCGAVHLASVMRRVLGGWALVCRFCGVVPWRAR
jgi:transcription elongation factor Elf1